MNHLPATPGPIDLLDDSAPASHGYGAGVICLFVRLVLNGVSLRGAERVMALISEVFGLGIDIPDWTTGRLWLMRLGHAMLTMPLPIADDWAWVMDHSVQIGKEKCLVILGVRLSHLPNSGECLRYEDMRLVALVVRTSWTREEVAQAMEDAVPRTGVPRVVVNDFGADVHGGVEIFRQKHPETSEVYDIKHKAACLLKHRLEKNPRWQEFQANVGQTRCAVQQTELGFLTPPAPKPKARFMNLQPQLEWADGVLDVLANPPAPVLQWTSVQRLEEKLGWLRGFKDDIAEWSSWQQIVNIAVTHVNGHGITRTTAKEVYQQMPKPFAYESTADLAKELTRFVARQGKQAKPGERLIGSTEVLESCFGKMKEMEKQHSRGGFTSLVISFGAMLATTTTEAINAALKHSRVADVHDWCKRHLGTTLFGKRKIAFAQGATEPG